MTWPTSLTIGFLCAIAGAIGAGWIASRSILWYRTSSFTGWAGYYVAVSTFVGGFFSAFLGIAVARLVTAGFVPALAVALGSVAVAGGIFFLLVLAAGEIPPKIGGETLFIQAELMTPPGFQLTETVRESPGNDLRLYSITRTGSTLASEHANLDLDHTRLEVGRLVIPGSIFLFTSAGRRGISFSLQGEDVANCLAPIPAAPSRQDLRWSPWAPDDPSAPYRYRFRLRLSSDVQREGEQPSV